MEVFTIDVVWNGKEYCCEARLAAVGYAHKFLVLINGFEVTYEPDEERNYRAISIGVDHGSMKEIDIELIKAVGAEIQSFHTGL